MEQEVLVLDGDSSQCLPVMRSLRRRGFSVTTVSPYRTSCGYFSRYANRRLIWPDLKKSRGAFLDRLYGYVRQKRPFLTLALGDTSSELLSCEQDDLRAWTRTIVPAYPIFQIAADKYQTMQLCMEIGVPCPWTLTESQIQEAVYEWPSAKSRVWVAKPRKGVGALGVVKVEGKQDIDRALASLVPKYGPYLVQEYIDGIRHLTAEVFCDGESELKACVVMEKRRFVPKSGGTSSCCVVVVDREIEEMLRLLMKTMGWIGNANIDMIVDKVDGAAKVIEVNPRLGAVCKAAYFSGVDLTEMQLELAEKRAVKNREIDHGGLVLRNELLELIWYVQNKDVRKTTWPRFWRVIGGDIYYQTAEWSDPLPVIGSVLSNVRKYVVDWKRLKEKIRGTEG